VLSLLLKIAVFWTSVSLFCTSLWGLLLARRSAPKASTPPIGASTQTRSEEEVAALLSTPRSSNPDRRPPSLPERKRAQQG
jgi:hypothetical protein